MRIPLSAACCLLSVNLANAGDLPRPTGDTVVSPEAKLELLSTRTAPIAGGLTEGPAAAPDGSIYFTDIPRAHDKGKIMRFDPQTGQTTIFIEDSNKANGLEFDSQGRLYACEGADQGGRALVRWDIATKKRTVIADRFMGKRFNAPNDLCLDRLGRVYFTDPMYVGDEPQELEHRAVYRVDNDGHVVEVTHDVEMPNGLAISPDQNTLYVADTNSRRSNAQSGAMKIYAFPLNSEGLVGGPRKTLYDFGEQAGCDGITLDRQGRLYLAARSANRPGVLVLSPGGQEVAFIPTGVPGQKPGNVSGAPSNVTFGSGSDKHTLYITIGVSLYRIVLKSEPFVPWDG